MRFTNLKSQLAGKKVLNFTLSVLITSAYCTYSHAQVSITLGAQSFYDDNIYLENNQDRPAPVVFNDDVGNPTPVDVSSLENFDGKENDDIINNIFAQAAGKISAFEKTINTNYDLRTGAILFVDNNNQDRLTLDGQLTTSLSKNILPEPYYLSLRNAVQSNSNNLAVASGTATQSTQNYIISAETGLSNARLTRDTSFDLGYSGSYQIYLGEFYLNEDKESADTEQQGTDFHSHVARTALKNQVTKNLEIGATASGGVQLFTKVHNGAYSSALQDPEDLDRTNAELQGTTSYILTKKLSVNASAGLAYSKLMNAPESRTVEIFNEDGTSRLETIEPEDSNTGLTYTATMDYAYQPGGLVTLGSSQGFATNLDGSRFLSRMFFANLVETLTNDLRVTLGTRYVQFEDESKLRPDTGRFEGSISLNYHLSESLSVNCGYNYADQSADKSNLSDDLRFFSPDYQSNRFFVGITGGFIGLPL